MRITMQLFSYFVLMFYVLTCEALFEDVQKVEKRLLTLEECLLPKDHFLNDPLDAIFNSDDTSYKTFKSSSNWEKSGFMLLRKKTNPSFMVAQHPSIENFLFKKYKNEVSSKEQIDNYVNRVSAARALRNFIELNNLQHIVVPQKWLYKLPRQFSDSNTGDRSYILIVEKMDICPGGRSSESEVGIRYKDIDFDVLRELCIVLYYFRGLDSSLRNMPFTYQNKITFIDTEKWLDDDREFLQHALIRLAPDRQQYALSIWNELCAQDKK